MPLRSALPRASRQLCRAAHCPSSADRRILLRMGQSPDISEVYRPPAVDVSWEKPSAPTALPAFYVVSPTKFVILFVCTTGIYQLYWFYRHFRQAKLAVRDDSWPVARAIFAIFFTHDLFRRINMAGGYFNADTFATMYVILAIVARIIDRVSSASETFGVLDLLGIVLGLATGMPLFTAQKAANRACGDPEGQQNSRFTLANFGWCGFGMLMWLLVLAGALLPAVPE